MGNLQDRMQIYSSIAKEAQRASASTATRVTLTSPWLSRTAMSSLCLGVTLRSSRTDTTPILQVSAGPKAPLALPQRPNPRVDPICSRNRPLNFDLKIIYYANKSRSKRVAVGEYLRIL